MQKSEGTRGLLSENAVEIRIKTLCETNISCSSRDHDPETGVAETVCRSWCMQQENHEIGLKTEIYS